MGVSGSYRQAALDLVGLRKMEKHGLRQDFTGRMRRIREVDPLVYRKLDGEDLVANYEAHVAGAKRNKGADALALHAFVQFPTDIAVDPDSEQMMLTEAVRFVNKLNGGDAVFFARLDRDEAGQHGVDVFFAPRYEKITKTGRSSGDWISLTRFSKDLAERRYGNSGLRWQGRALQDEWHEHLVQAVGPWVQRGRKKLTIDPDRLEPEVYKVAKDRERLDGQTAAYHARAQALHQRTVSLDQRQKSIDEMEVALSRRVHLDECKDEAIHLYLQGDIKDFKWDPAHGGSVSFSEWFHKGGHAARFMKKIEGLLPHIVRALEPFRDFFQRLNVGLDQRQALSQTMPRPCLYRRDDGMSL